MGKYLKTVLIVFLVVSIVTTLSAAKKKHKKNKGLILRQKETNAVNFLRLAIMRLVYGIATRIGFGEQISEALNGAFVPPGAEYDDYGDGGLDLLDRDDDYDY